MSEPILATEAERDVALALLREASVDGRLTLEDLADRAEMVHVARTRDDLATATAGLARRRPGAPLIRIRHSGLLGSISVRSAGRRR